MIETRRFKNVVIFIQIIFSLYLEFYQNFYAGKLNKTYLLNVCFAWTSRTVFWKKIRCHIFRFLCHILSFGSSGLNCKFIRREYGFSIDSKISVMSSGNKPILTLKISVANFSRFRYFADFDIRIVPGQNSFARIAFCYIECCVF